MTTLDLSFRDGLSPAIAAMIKRADDLTPAMQEIADYMEFSTRQRFETGKAPDGTPWKPSTRYQKVGKGKTARIEAYTAEKTLVFRGHLLASIDRAFGPNSATVGTNVIYARIQQFGGTITAKNGKGLKTPFGYVRSVTLPARPYIGFNTDDKTEIFHILRGHYSHES